MVWDSADLLQYIKWYSRPHKKTKLFLVPSLLTFGCRITFFFFFFFFYKNADNALEIELKHSKIEMPLPF